MNNRIENIAELPENVQLAISTLSDELQTSEILSKILIEIHNGWSGEVGFGRCIENIAFIGKIIPQYAALTGKTQLETLEIIAKARCVNYTNYFQHAYIPDLSDVMVFDTIEDVRKAFPSKQYICPCCGGISTDYQECNSGVMVGEKKTKYVCDWKVYGLFGDMGKGIKVLVKDMFDDIPKPIAMFKPVELIEK